MAEADKAAQAAAVPMFRQFIQAEMDARGWDRPTLERVSGLSRSHVQKLLTANKLGRMPDEKTLQGLAHAFGSYEKVRMAASRALRGYEDTGSPLHTDLASVHIDALLLEIRSRVLAATGYESQWGLTQWPPVEYEDPGVGGAEDGDETDQFGVGQI